MTARVIDGKARAALLTAEIQARVAARVAAGGRPPGLAVVLVGENGAETSRQLDYKIPIGAEPGKYKPASSYVYGVGAFLMAGSELCQITGGAGQSGHNSE